MKQNKIIIILAMSISAFLAGSCNTDVVDKEEQRTLRMVYTDWSESVALSYLSSYLLEEKLGYEVTMKLTDVKSVYRELGEGKADVFTDAWLPRTHKRYYEDYSGEIELLGITYPEARTGLVVPEYSDLQKVSDLKNYPHPVIGIDTGAGVMHKTRAAIKKYKLNVKLLNLSEEKMLEHLQDSIKRRKEVVVTGWEPHWIFARYDVRFLEDPDNIFGEKEKIYTVAHKDLKNIHPHAARFFERMQLSEKQLNSLVYQLQLNSEDPIKGVKAWIGQNEYVVNQWLKDLAPERKKIM
ncbi:MAG: hypothetical protein K9I94_08060 [Bacteroidales bacterium]|nr:hypothetical protein [Bacteroidales bacterium]